MAWDKTNKVLLLSYALNKEAFMNALGGHVDPQDLFRAPSMESFALALRAFASFRDKKDQFPIGPGILEAEVENIQNEFSVSPSDNHVEEAQELIRKAYCIPNEDLADFVDVGKGMCKEFVWSFHYKSKLLGKLKSTNSLDKALAIIGEEQEKMQSVRSLEQSLTQEPYSNPEEHFHVAKRQHTGLSVWDDLFEHGVMKGNIYYILGPTGFGKSTLMTQLAWSLSTGGRVYYCIFEGQHDRPINPGEENILLHSQQLERFLCQAGDVSRSKLSPPDGMKKDVYTVDDMPHSDDIKSAMKKVKDRLDGNILIHDGTESTGPTSVGELLDDVKREHENGGIDALFLDPLRQLIEETIVAEGLSGSDNLFRERAMKFADEITNFADKHAIPVFLTHQLRSKDADRKGSKNISAYAGGEVRTMSWPFQNVIVICPPKNSEVSHIVVPKSRMEGEANRFIKVRLNGDKCVFTKYGPNPQQFVSEEDAEDDDLMENTITSILTNQTSVEDVHKESLGKDG